jgi:hypothetical protein
LSRTTLRISDDHHATFWEALSLYRVEGLSDPKAKGGVAMEDGTDLLNVGLMAAIAVAVGLTSAAYASSLLEGDPCEDKAQMLTGKIANAMGLDESQVADFLRGSTTQV